MTYQAPSRRHHAGAETAAGLDALPRQGHARQPRRGYIRAIVEEAGKFGAEVLDP